MFESFLQGLVIGVIITAVVVPWMVGMKKIVKGVLR